MRGFKDFQHVTISVSDVSRSLAFYRDLLGFPALGRLYYRNKVGLVIDFLGLGNDTILEIFSFQNATTKPSEWVADDLQLGLRHIGFKVRDVDEVTARLKAAGVPFTLEPMDAAGGVRIAFFRDPDGNSLEIVQGEVRYHTGTPTIAPWPVSHCSAAPIRELSLDHVAMTVSDLEPALRFYQDILGFPLLGQLFLGDARGFTITYLRAGSAVLELFSFSVPTIEHRWNPDETVLGLKHLGFLVQDVATAADELMAHGVRIIYPPANALGNVTTCFFADPDGNALELIDGTCTYDE